MVNRISSKTQFKLVAKATKWDGLATTGEEVETAFPKGVQLCKTGLVVPKELEQAEWEAIGRTLAKMDTCLQWAIGDWWAHGFYTYGDRKAEAVARALPYEFGSLMNLGTVARKVQASLRNEALSFSHHVVVAPLEPKDQKEWLGRAAKEKWTVKELRQKLGVLEQRKLDTDAEYLANDTVEKFLKDVERSLWVARNYQPASENSDWIELEGADDKKLTKLVELSQEVVDAWQGAVRGLTKFQERRKIAAKRVKTREMIDRPVANKIAA